MHNVERPHCFLFDNGSLRPSSTLSLRRTAKALQAQINVPVHAVSLLHSTGVPASELEGEPAELLEPALVKWLTENPAGQAVVLPFFFGPSAALTEYVPERLDAVRAKFPQSKIRLAHCLVDPAVEADTRIASALADAARRVMTENEIVKPKVILVDHGSPQAAVAEVRDHLGEQVNALLKDEISLLGVASMERRPGPQYAFNDPLLSVALTSMPFSEGDVVVLLQFLSPGRHAGPSGDIAEICQEASRGRRQLNTYITDPIGNDPRVVDVLIQRYEEVVRAAFAARSNPPPAHSA